MIRKFCDRCGVERNELTQILIPKENRGMGSFISESIEVCEECNKLNINLLETLTVMRFSLYENVFMKRNGVSDEQAD